MKVLLIEPNSKFAIRSALGIGGPPLGLAYLSAYIKKHSDHEVKVLDALTLELAAKDVREEIRAFRPDIVGINVMSTPSVYDAYGYARIAKAVRKGVFVVLGGQHVTFASRETLAECPHVDAVVKGEGEVTFLETVNRLSEGKSLRGCKGTTYRAGKRILDNLDRKMICNLDTVPFPDYSQLPMDRYRMGGHRFGAIITSRGCPFGCKFCASSRMVGRMYRSRSARNVVEELKVLKGQHGVSEIEFLDDLFTMDPKRVKELCGLIRKERLGISWTCSSRVDILNRNPEIARWLKQAGCHTVYVGAESGCQKSLDAIGKGITLKQTRKAVKILKGAGLNVLASFVLGIPGETKDEMQMTIDFAKELDPDFAQFTICTPFPGTPLYTEMKREGRILARRWSDFTIIKPVMQLSHASFDDVHRMLRKAYVSFYIRPSFIWKNIRYGNFRVLKNIFSAGLNYALNIRK
jgi:radical SAM superfamily enzyme YgiQ (UPF0313 family)